MPVPSRLAASALAIALVLLAGCSREHRDILGTERKLYSQFDEELVIRDFFQDRRGGFFLDVGASTPVENSTTYYLEKHLGWSGIGIDALFEYYVVWRLQRPRSEYLSFLVTDHSGTRETFYRSIHPPLSSVQKDRVFDGVKLEGEAMEVETTTLDKVLDERGVEKIDFLSMDIEESEPPALAGFDIERYLAADSINWYFQPRQLKEEPCRSRDAFGSEDRRERPSHSRCSRASPPQAAPARTRPACRRTWRRSSARRTSSTSGRSARRASATGRTSWSRWT